MLVCKHVGKRYGSEWVLKDCNFRLAQGQVMGIMGKSGSGKTSLARLLVGLETATSGSILVDDKRYNPKVDGPKILLVFQDALNAVNPRFSVSQVLKEALPSQVQDQALRDILQAVGLDKVCLSQKARQLSGGQLQRLCIARALLLKPKVIIFDESLSALDPLTQVKLLELLDELKNRYQLSYIMISHDPKICQAICDQLFVMKDGMLVENHSFLKSVCSSSCLNFS
ncbi:ABC transporter ATP-binding protein [Streptococcus ictaluri]|uniref:ABC transporter, ATP-binding protein n=1 Tax=Streptococcus ictaluri 707-05 TaxID=764299 RepID=G5K1R3_9STRE|nr:dipeptide/oligopeptide/nickel ABC transporter ATP-binding protein [Streptococcus ictaluri]EHI70144.1 ABC transporter, ATP-binding protein [Streptococcus ictaluri 707-05]